MCRSHAMSATAHRRSTGLSANRMRNMGRFRGTPCQPRLPLSSRPAPQHGRRGRETATGRSTTVTSWNLGRLVRVRQTHTHAHRTLAERVHPLNASQNARARLSPHLRAACTAAGSHLSTCHSRCRVRHRFRAPRRKMHAAASASASATLGDTTGSLSSALWTPVAPNCSFATGKTAPNTMGNVVVISH